MSTLIRVVPEIVNVEVPRGSSIRITVAIVDDQGAAIDVFGNSEEVRAHFGARNGSIRINELGTNLDQGSGNIVQFDIDTSTWAEVEAIPWSQDVDLVWSVQRTAFTGEKYDHVEGRFKLSSTPSSGV